MATVYLAPDPIQSTQLVPGGNTPASAAQMFFYVAGSSTKTTVYKDSGGGVAWTNPIVLDSGGNLPSNGSVWIATGVTVDVVLAPSNDTDPPASPYWTKEDISGINDVSASLSEWVSGPSPTFVSGTQFVLQGDQTANFKGQKRIRTTNTGGTIYSTITQSIASVGSTTVNVRSDSGALDSGLSATFYSLLDSQNASINSDYVNKHASAVASDGNGTTNIWGIAGNTVHITGTNTIFSFSSSAYAGARRTVIFDGALTLTHSSTSFNIPGGANVTTTAGDRMEVVASTAANAVITQYTRGIGTAMDSGWKLLATQTPTATSSADFISILSSTFDEYIFELIDVLPVSSATNLLMLTSSTNGASFTAGSGYRYAGWTTTDAPTTGQTTNTGTAQFVLATPVGSTSGRGVNGEVKCWNGVTFRCSTHNNFISDADAFQDFTLAGKNNDVGVNAIQFKYSNDNIASGTIRLYGVRKS